MTGIPDPLLPFWRMETPILLGGACSAMYRYR